jgi:hypothetical protein
VTEVVQDDGWLLFSDKTVRNRSCGTCRLCCVLVPVVTDEWEKAAGEKCRHLRHKGCAIYETRPLPCRAWSCRFLIDPLTRDLRRPDRAGYVIDPMRDTILIDEQPATVLQIWCDPAQPGAHRDPDLRAYLEAIGRKFGMLAIVRFANASGLLLCPPCLSDTGEWQEKDAGMPRDRDEFAAKLAALAS